MEVEKELKKLIDRFGSAQVCVWIGIQDTRTVNTWISRGVPIYRKEQVKLLLKRKLK